MFKADGGYADKLLPDPATCAHCRALRYDTNVLVLQRLSDLSTLSTLNLSLAIGCVMYLGTTVVCLIYTLEEHSVTDVTFHRLEFGSTFAFTLVTTFALVFSPERRFQSPLILKALVLINVCASFVAMLLVFMSLGIFERIAHQIEYSNELCTAFVDVLILLTLEPTGSVQQRPSCHRVQLVCLSTLAVCVPALQLVVYNAPWGGEQPARYIEFCVNSLSAAISFWFCTDSMILADKLKLEIMLAPNELTVVIDDQSRRAVHDHGEPTTPYSPPRVPPSAPCGNCPSCLARQDSLQLPASMKDAATAAAPGFRITKGSLPVPPQETGPLLGNIECAPCEP